MATETIKIAAINKLHHLVNNVDSLIESTLEEFTAEEVSFILSNYGDSLKLSLKGPFEARQTVDREASPLNDLFNT